MAFKKIAVPPTVPDSPEKLLREFPRRKIEDVLLHQGEVMREYARTCLDEADVALQLPTGSGKTLVGLMIGEWRRRRSGEHVVYLCPTRQLVNQVVSQAVDSYGLTVNGFTGSAREYDPQDKAAYISGERIAVTTYNSLFNSNPFFSDPDVIIIDDAHAADNYVSTMWSLRIERSNSAHQVLHTVIAGILKDHLDPADFARLEGEVESTADRTWVDKLPSPTFFDLREKIVAAIDAHAPETDLIYAWRLLRDRLHACHLYLSPNEILIRPLFAPTWTHSPFAGARQRIYMSATLGAGGDLERLMGRESIKRIAVPEQWNRQGVGRRLFIFPEMSLSSDEAVELRCELMQRAGRSLVLVPSDLMRDTIANNVKERLEFKTFSATDIEVSKKPFVNSAQAVALVANRYDGIDFPGEECRLLFIEGLPKATNIQDRFLMSRMGANVLFNERVQTRVLQAIGRCTRSLTDYSAVVVSGEELPSYLVDKRRHKFFHPELQAEITFGIDQSKENSKENILENFQIFIANGKEWEDANEQITALRDSMVQEPFPAIDELRAVVNNEVKFQQRLWQGDYEAALEAAQQVLAGLNHPALRGYRALWHYLAGSAASLGARAGISALQMKARNQFSSAKSAATGIPWLVALARHQRVISPEESAPDSALMSQIERIERFFESVGTLHDRTFERRVKEVMNGLRSATAFEQAHRSLGDCFGFETGKIEGEASPDAWWIAGQFCFVFEDHANASLSTVLDATKARQVASHPAWMRENVPQSVSCKTLSVLITPVKSVRKAAAPHLKEVALWPIVEFRDWAAKGFAVLRILRGTYTEPGDLDWRARAAEAFVQSGLDASGLFEKLRKRPAAEALEQVA